jgi:cytochrome o ubiquinol oxidase subunit 1
VITILAFVVWLHHFFTMGAGADVNAFFGITTMVIAIPTGVKVFNWLFTMYGGRIRFEVPVLWTIGFMITFVIGGMTGVLLAVPSNDFLLHNSLFLIAHFHNVIIGGVLFGCFAGMNYWFPKAFGFKLDPGLGKGAFWCWFIGFYLAFMPLYVLGFLGMTRRMNHYDNPLWTPYLLVACAGAFLILLGIILQILQLVVSIRNWRSLRDLTGDPWQGRTFEWSIPSPPPIYNFAIQPQVESLDAYWHAKAATSEAATPIYRDIRLPKNSPAGFLIAFFAAAGGFAVIWHIWWLALIGLVGGIASLIGSSWREHEEVRIPADEIAHIERTSRALAKI